MLPARAYWNVNTKRAAYLQFDHKYKEKSPVYISC